MQVVKKIEIDDNEGLLALLDQRITVYCMNYIYTGTLSGVNKEDIKLTDASIVYDTGSFEEKNWKDSQKFPKDIYLRTSAIEMYTVLK